MTTLLITGAVALVFVCSPLGNLARRILGRAKILLLTIILLLPWTTPGVYAIESMGVLSPTREGLLLCFTQLLHSCIVLIGLGWALNGLEVEARTAGLIYWLKPLARLGLPIDRFAMRLLLTLQFLESKPRYTSWQSWVDEWQSLFKAEKLSVVPQEIVIDIGFLSWLDRLIMIFAILGVVLCVGL